MKNNMTRFLVMDHLLLLVKTSRPGLWVVAPFVFYVFCPVCRVRSDLLPTVQMILLSFPYSFFLYGINDIYDYPSDKVNPRKAGGMLAGGALDPSYHTFVRRICLLCGVLLLVSSLVTCNLENILGMSVLLVISYMYSAPPVRFKEFPPLDSVANGIIYVLGPGIMGYSYGGSIARMPYQAYFLALCVVGLHSFSTIPDYTPDKLAGTRTFAVVFGKRSAALTFLAILIATVLFGGMISYAQYLLLAFALLPLSVSIYPSEKLAALYMYLIYSVFVSAFILGYLFDWPIYLS